MGATARKGGCRLNATHSAARALRWVSLLLPGLLGACSNCKGGGDRSVGVIKHVEIVPPVIYAATGAKVRLEAIGRSSTQAPVPGKHAVTWSGSAFFQGATDNPTLVHANTAGDHPIAVQMASISQSARLIVSAPGTGTADKITLAHTNNDPVSVVLLDAQDVTTSACHHDKTLGIAGLARLDVNLKAGCGNTLAVLAEGRAARYECQTGDAAGCGSDPASRWTTGYDNVELAPLTDPLTVDVVVWYRVAVDIQTARKDAQNDLAYANSVFSSQRVGMKFNLSSDSEDGQVLNFVAATGADRCAGADTQLGITPVPGALNVVYVEQVHIGIHTDVRGLMCDRTDGAPRLIIISRTEMAPATPAHELAHVMGLMERAFTELAAHTTGLPGFNATNLMWAAEDAAFGLDRDHLTVGQALRMNIDDRSWVNLERTGAFSPLGRIRKGDTEHCQGTRNTNKPCPVLHLELGTS